MPVLGSARAAPAQLDPLEVQITTIINTDGDGDEVAGNIALVNSRLQIISNERAATDMRKMRSNLSSEAELADRPLSEEQIRAAHVDEVTPLNGRILLVDYDPRWADLFEREARRLRAVIPQEALRIEHVGSTSVPRLPAKPIVDIVLVVADSADEGAYLPALVSAGYRLHVREPDWHEHRMFNGPDTDINLHTFSAGCPEIDRMLLFRDWLRANPTDRELYARTKSVLAQKEWRFVQNYADAKSAVVADIMARAGRQRSR